MTELSSSYFAVIDLTFENTTNKWMTISEARVSFEDEKLNESIEFPIGNKLLVWAEAAKRMKQINDYNSQIIMGSIAAAGGLMASTGNQNAGLVALTTGVTGLTVKGIQKNLQSIEQSKQVPEDHLLSGEFLIPPGLHTKKWFTIFNNTPFNIPYVKTVVLTYKQNGSVKTSKLDVRKSFNFSDFQSSYESVQAERRNVEERKKRQEAAIEDQKKWAN